MLGFGDYFWRLIPANPILLRVVETSGKRRRDLFVRCGYLGLLVLFVIFSLITSGGTSAASLRDLAMTSASIFQKMSYLQLALVALLAPIFTAGAITQEKDSQTYDILLATPLTNGQIVLGSLLSRLFFVLALLISGIPVFAITQIFGGVAIRSIVYSFAIAAATTCVTGALAMAIATFKVGTRRTIFSFYLFIVVYLVGLFLLDRLDFFKPIPNPPPLAGREIDRTTWFTAIHPFLALRVVLDPSYQPPELGALPPPLQAWPIGWCLSRPHHFYVWFMSLLSVVLVLPSMAFLRRMAQSTTSPKGWLLQRLHLSSGDRNRKPRPVWHNPIAWREARTKASAARAMFLRYGFIAFGLAGAMALVILYARKAPADKYVTSGSYDPTSNTLSIISGDNADTYRVDATTAVRIGTRAATLDDIRGRLAVKAIGSKGTRLTSLDLAPIQRRLSPDQARNFLLGAVIIEFAVILLIVTNAAASTVTREKEDGSLDLLLSTPITSRYYVWGKLRGLVSYVLPLVAIPVASALLFILYDVGRLIGGADAVFEWIVFPEAVVVMPGVLIIVAAFAAILGMQMSLRCRTTVRAVMSSVGIVLGACGGLAWCGFSALQMRGHELNLIMSSFSPFTILTLLIHPVRLGGLMFDPDEGRPTVARLIVFTVGFIAIGGYAALVWSMYRSMVKNFDMTIRKQQK